FSGTNAPAGRECARLGASSRSILPGPLQPLWTRIAAASPLRDGSADRERSNKVAGGGRRAGDPESSRGIRGRRSRGANAHAASNRGLAVEVAGPRLPLIP